MATQKDWVIYDIEGGDIFCLSIIRYSEARGKRKKQWFLTQYSNYFNLDSDRLSFLLRENSADMLKSTRNTKEYSYSIAKHKFLPKDMSPNYWKGILSRKTFTNTELQNIHIPVNRKNLEKEIDRLVPNIDHRGTLI